MKTHVGFLNSDDFDWETKDFEMDLLSVSLQRNQISCSLPSPLPWRVLNDFDREENHGNDYFFVEGPQ